MNKSRILSKKFIGFGDIKIKELLESLKKASDSGSTFLNIEYDQTHRLEKYHGVWLLLCTDINANDHIDNEIELLKQKIIDLESFKNGKR